MTWICGRTVAKFRDLLGNHANQLHLASIFATKGTFNAMREGYFGPGMAGTHYQPPETTDPEGLGGKKM